MSPTAAVARRGARALAASITRLGFAPAHASSRRGLASTRPDAHLARSSSPSSSSPGSGPPRFAALLGTAAASAGAYAFLLDDEQSSAAQFKLFEYLAPAMRRPTALVCRTVDTTGAPPRAR